MKITKNLKLIALMLASTILFTTNCVSTAKLSTEFKSQKKHVDTLCLLEPAVKIISKRGTIQSIDSQLTKVNKELLEKITSDLLDSKYIIEKSEFSINDFSILDEMYQNLENSPKLINKVSINSFLEANVVDKKSRYILLLTYIGGINPDFAPNYNIKAGIASNSVIINPGTKPFSDIRLVIIDRIRKEVVYYDSFYSSNYDPRLPENVEQMTKTILKSIYYK